MALRLVLFTCLAEVLACGFVLADGDEEGAVLTLERIYGSDDFEEPEFAARWVGDGSAYTRLEESEGPAGGRDIVRYDARTGERAVLVPADHLVPPGESGPLAIDDYAWSADRSLLLVYTNSRRVWRQKSRGDYWVLDRSSRELRKLGGGAAPSSLQFAKFSPAAPRVAYVREKDIHVEDLRTGEILRVTTRACEHVINGTFDWVYEEEFGLRDGFRWSPDGGRIAYWEIDTEGVREFPLVNNTDSLYPRIEKFAYPKAGETNSACRVGVVDAGGGETRWLDVPGDPRNHYLARMEWGDAETLVLQQLNRLQNTKRVMLADARSGEVTTVYTDRDDAWVEVVDELEWFADGQRFTWVSERDGWRHIYAVSRAGGQAACITPGDYDVIRLLQVDEKGGWLYFLASPENPTQRYLYRCPLDGGAPERITPAEAKGTHSYQMSPGAGWAIHRFSTFDTPPVIDLVSLPDHRRVRLLEDNSTLRRRVEKLARQPGEFFRVPIAEGVELDGWCMKPPDLDPGKKHPLLIYVYGEPAGQTVLDRWGGSGYLWHLLLAQRGYLVMSFDNRGTPAPRGRAWRKSIYRRVGILAPEDQAAALRKVLETRPYTDGRRVAIWGWSGGGSMSLNAIFKYPDLYHTAMSVAPVPNQRYYDTIYQERYMGLPADNVEGFRNGSPINYAHQLEGNLLLIHGTGDDNCHYQGTEALINELVRHRKPFTLMAYPNRSHSIRERINTTLHLRELLTRYLTTHVAPGPREEGDGSVTSYGSRGDGPAKEERFLRHRLQTIEGWRVQVDETLLQSEADLGRMALETLAHELFEIRLRVPADKLRHLQAVPLWIDLDHPLRTMQYHPSAGWLEEHEYDPRMEKCVHIPRAQSLIDLQRTNHQPWVLLHELAHAYHDRVLGFDYPPIKKAYDRAVAAKIYESVLLNRGKPARHYALSDHKEFFAEMSEAYFGTNDFYPFVKAELEEHDPETFALLEEVWGEVP